MGSESAPHLTKADLLALDIDVRLHSVILWALEDTPDEALLSAFLRLAYAAGYQDALADPVRGQLLRDHGFAVPTRRRGQTR
jgi:hypothetical protein